MDKIGFIEISITGSKGNLDLTPDNYDIREIVNIRENAETGEIDTSTSIFIELVSYQPKYDEQYLKSLREKAKKSWLGSINPENWLKDIRGGYDA